MKDFLIELQTEELPPKLLPKIINSLADNFAEEFEKYKLKFNKILQFATSRKIAILVKDLNEKQDNQIIHKKGPITTANKKAIEGFANSNGVDINQLIIEKTKKGNYYYFKSQQQGQKTSTILEEISKNSIKNIPITRPMRWGENEFSFIRPVHSLIMLFDTKIIPATIMNLKSGRTTTAMRFNDNIITIKTASDYQKTILKQGKIEVDFTKRQQNIKYQIEKIANDNNLKIIENKTLLIEVCALVENPKVFIGNFAKEFLELPKEVIINTMAEHQKYFSLVDDNDNLVNKFIAVSNTQSTDISLIIQGNEKVIKPRLEDAKFFWQQDQKTTLDAKLKKLKTVIFMQGLGTMLEKSRRIETLAGLVAEKIGANIKLAKRAGKLAKADLASNMVGELANLQGIIGGYYALIDQEEKAVSQAISCHYNPKFAGDILPTNAEGLSVAIADKIDTICGVFAIGKIPTGSKDPYGLRRLALGLIRILIEKKINIELKELINTTLSLYNNINKKITNTIFDFIIERLRSYYQEKNIKITAFMAASNKSNNPYDLHLRIIAIDKFNSTKSGKDLIAINKRINNILKDTKFKKNNNLTHIIEKDLNKKIEKIEKSQLNDYELFIQDLLSLKPYLDNFFHHLVINDKNKDIRDIRLTLLMRVSVLFAKIGNLKLLTD